MRFYFLAALAIFCSLALAQAIIAPAQPELIYVHLSRPGVTLSAQPLTLAVPTELRSGVGGIAASYSSPNTQGMRVVLGNDGHELYLQIESKYSASLETELNWLAKIGALQNIDESSISQISAIAQNSREISYSSSAGWISPQTTAPTQVSPVASKIWEEQAAAEKAPANTPSGAPPNEPTPTGVQRQEQQPSATGSSAPSETAQKTAQGQESAQPFPSPSTGATAQKTESEGAAKKTTGAFDATAQQQKSIFDLVSMLAPLLTAAAVILVAIVAVLLRSPSNEQIETHRILSSPTRVEILNELSTNEKIPTDLSSRLGKSKATIIEHLERMREAGFVEKVQTPGKKFVYYRITSKGKTAMLRSAA